MFVKSGKSEDWVSSYLFITPTSGKQFTDHQMSEYFARNSFRIIGKRITPHTFRYMWAKRVRAGWVVGCTDAIAGNCNGLHCGDPAANVRTHVTDGEESSDQRSHAEAPAVAR
jgi:integrase